MVLPPWRPKRILSVLLRVFAWLQSVACYIQLRISRLSFKPWLCPDCVKKRSWRHQPCWPSDISLTTEFLRLSVGMYCWYSVEVNVFYASMSYALGSSLIFKKTGLEMSWHKIHFYIKCQHWWPECAYLELVLHWCGHHDSSTCFYMSCLWAIAYI